MYIFFIVLILIASVLLILSVLAQNPKSGMAANFGAIAIFVLSLAATMTMPSANIANSKGAMERAIEQATEGNENLLAPAQQQTTQDAAQQAPQSQPAAPAQQPVE